MNSVLAATATVPKSCDLIGNAASVQSAATAPGRLAKIERLKTHARIMMRYPVECLINRESRKRRPDVAHRVSAVRHAKALRKRCTQPCAIAVSNANQLVWAS